MGTIEMPAANRRLAKKRAQCLNEALCFVSSSVLADILVLRNRQLLIAANHYGHVDFSKNLPFFRANYWLITTYNFHW